MMDYAPIDIICPFCKKCAQFNEPFLFSSQQPKNEKCRQHRWGGWYVIEKYPSLLPWTAPKKTSSQFLRGGGRGEGGGDGPGYALMHKGVIQCVNCHQSGVHTLTWPDDAWWQWEVRGKLLFAYNRKDALVILDYIQATHRPGRTNSSTVGLIPTHFLTAKVRPEVVTKMRQSL